MFIKKKLKNILFGFTGTAIHCPYCKSMNVGFGKSHLEWCPKGYADDIIKGLSLINKSTSICERIVREKCI